MEPTGETEPKPGRPRQPSKPGHVVCSNVKHLMPPDHVQNRDQSDTRQTGGRESRSEHSQWRGGDEISRDDVNAEGQLLCWPGPLLCYPKHGPQQRTRAPLAPKEQRWGVGMERKRVQLGDRGLLGGAQLAARVLTAVKHKSMSM